MIAVDPGAYMDAAADRPTIRRTNAMDEVFSTVERAEARLAQLRGQKGRRR